MRTSQSQVRDYCLFVKVYLPTESDDSFLRRVVRPALERDATLEAFPRFFFMRYRDPDYHLRLRFFGDLSAVLGPPRVELLGYLESRLKKYGARMQLARYRPEFKRYGGRPGIRIAEKIFCASTRAVLGFLNTTESDGIARSRAEFALVSAEAILDALGMNLSQRNELYRGVRIDRGLDESAFSHLTSIARQASSCPSNILKRDRQLQPVIERIYQDLRGLKLLGKARGNQLREPVRGQIASYIHMHFNRLKFFPVYERILLSARAAGCRSSK